MRQMRLGVSWLGILGLLVTLIRAGTDAFRERSGHDEKRMGGPAFLDASLLVYGAEGETRTRTGISPLPPQGSVSTNFTTSA